jgi:alpha-beta hydrolase superfamily lysophospholipase
MMDAHGRRSIPVLAALLAASVVASCAPRIEEPGSPIGPPTLTAGDFVTADGLKLPLQEWLPDTKPPKAVILALHGMNDYANAFAMPGAWWAKHDIATIAYDQRGFGRAPHAGHWSGTAAMVDDLGAMVLLLRQRYPHTPLYLLGESMGGAVVMAALARPDCPSVDGVILAAPAVWGRPTMDLGMRVLLFIGAHTVPWFTLSGRGLNITPSDNREMLLALGRDPLVIKQTRIDAIWGLVNLMDDALAAAPKLDAAPLLILFGEHDDVIPNEPTRDMIAALPPDPPAPRKIAIYRKGYHLLLRDLEAQVVWQDVLAWIDNSGTTLPSGADKTDLKDWRGG